MPTLIDGHNLIGRLPDIDLADPNDEARLVAKLKTYCARTGRKVTVIFDHGMPGGKSHELSGGGVDARFAPVGRSADAVLRERIRKSRNPRGLTIVTSDRGIIARAESRGARVVRSEDFAEQLAGGTGDDVQEDEKPAAGDVAYWMARFARRQEKNGGR